MSVFHYGVSDSGKRLQSEEALFVHLSVKVTGFSALKTQLNHVSSNIYACESRGQRHPVILLVAAL